MELGFRSAFNFVPEGEYRVPESLRGFLTASGFEVGVRSTMMEALSSRDEFRLRAKRVNFYLKEWKASGFRSGFMLHNLTGSGIWSQYDASTFDTDPFEPQPDGVNTIFPFWFPHALEPTPATFISTVNLSVPPF